MKNDRFLARSECQGSCPGENAPLLCKIHLRSLRCGGSQTEGISQVDIETHEKQYRNIQGTTQGEAEGDKDEFGEVNRKWIIERLFVFPYKETNFIPWVEVGHQNLVSGRISWFDLHLGKILFININITR